MTAKNYERDERKEPGQGHPQQGRRPQAEQQPAPPRLDDERPGEQGLGPEGRQILRGHEESGLGPEGIQIAQQQRRGVAPLAGGGAAGTREVQQRDRQPGDDDRDRQPELHREELNSDEAKELLRARPFDYIERTRPEDRLPAEESRGQITRDNVNPSIPSASRGEERIVDPHTLGMEQGGIDVPEQDPAHPQAMAQEDIAAPLGGGTRASVNEPPGSTIGENVETEGGGGEGGGGEGGGGEGETEPPDLLDIDPDVATIGDADLTLTCTGENFTEQSKIVFNGGEEETEFVDENTLTTIVKPSLAEVAGTFAVLVRDVGGESEPLDFEFVAEEEVKRSRERRKPAREPKKKKRKR